MKPPKFMPGDNALYENRVVKVTHIVNSTDPADVRAQGWRYYVRYDKGTWSVPESSLKSASIVSDSYEDENS